MKPSINQRKLAATVGVSIFIGVCGTADAGTLPEMSILQAAQSELIASANSIQSNRAARLRAYLSAITADGSVDQTTSRIAWQAWEAIQNSEIGSVHVPDAAPGPDGEILYIWDKGEHHLELEVFPSGIAEFFYRNRNSNELWEADFNTDEGILDGVAQKLRLFA